MSLTCLQSVFIKSGIIQTPLTQPVSSIMLGTEKAKNEGYGLAQEIKKASESTSWGTKGHIKQMFWGILNVLIKVLQRNRTNKNIYVCVCIHTHI